MLTLNHLKMLFSLSIFRMTKAGYMEIEFEEGIPVAVDDEYIPSR